jgi:hypothetical protein
MHEVNIACGTLSIPFKKKNIEHTIILSIFFMIKKIARNVKTPKT